MKLCETESHPGHKHEQSECCAGENGAFALFVWDSKAGAMSREYARPRGGAATEVSVDEPRVVAES